VVALRRGTPRLSRLIRVLTEWTGTDRGSGCDFMGCGTLEEWVLPDKDGCCPALPRPVVMSNLLEAAYDGRGHGVQIGTRCPDGLSLMFVVGEHR